MILEVKAIKDVDSSNNITSKNVNAPYFGNASLTPSALMRAS